MIIEVSRPKQYADMARDYRLLADGKNIAVLARGSTQTITLPEGTQELTAVIDWCSSPALKVSDIHSGKIEVRNAFASSLVKSLFLPLYYISFGRAKYLVIEPVKL